MTAYSPQRRIKQKFQAGHTEHRAGQGDLTDFSITHSLPYSITACGYTLCYALFFSLHRMQTVHMCTNRQTDARYNLFLSIKHLLYLKDSRRKRTSAFFFFYGRIWILSNDIRSCVHTLGSEPLRGSIRNVYIFSLPSRAAQSPIIYLVWTSSKIREDVFSCLASWNTQGIYLYCPH